MDDIRVEKIGQVYEVEMPDGNIRISARCVEDAADILRIDVENTARIRAIMESINSHINWEEIIYTFEPILRVVSPELLISYMLELPEYVIGDAELLLESVLEEYGGTF